MNNVMQVGRRGGEEGGGSEFYLSLTLIFSYICNYQLDSEEALQRLTASISLGTRPVSIYYSFLFYFCERGRKVRGREGGREGEGEGRKEERVIPCRDSMGGWLLRARQCHRDRQR